MPGVQDFSQQLRSIIDVVIRFVRARKREEATISFGALLILGGVYLANGLEKVGLKDFFTSWHGDAIVRYLLIAAGVGFVLYGAYKIFRLVYVPPMPPAKDRPSAIKGPMAFTEADGELFRKLGRESELQKLLGMALDDQVLLIVVRGASGAGKTSLLRAGLKHILGDRAIFHYWEAVPTEPDKGLLRALQEKWPEGAGRPASLDVLVNPADALGRQSHVFVLDQFEQLRGSRKIFQLLRRIVRESKPPHRITWVIAFREEFFSDWMKSIAGEYERGFHPPLMFLDWFTTEQAKDVIGQLMKEADLSFEDAVLNNLVEAATVEGKVSPVDISIGLLVLEEIYRKQGGKPITIRDYQFAGGAEGLLTQYIDRRLDEYFSKTDREKILKAMLALRDAETNQRLAEGRTVDELATESGAEARLLKTQLDRLSHRDTRLLETVTPADGSAVRYRLPHERLVPALYRLTGKLLAEVDQAKLKFQNAFQAWKTNGKRSHYLLKAKELRLVERYETQIPWGNDEQEKKGYLNRSKRHRQFIRAAAITAALAFIVSGWVSLQLYQRSEHKKYLSDEGGYPSELYDYQHQLKKLELTEPLNLDRFTWLSSDSIGELSLKAAFSSNSIAGLASLSKGRSLKKLTLDLSNSQVNDLEPLSKLSNLTQLTIDLSYSQVSNFEPLLKLNNLTQLTLKISYISYIGAGNLESLSKLDNLTQLTLDLRNNDQNNLESLTKLPAQTQLTLYLSSGQLRKLKDLPRLNNLTQLALDYSDSNVTDWDILSELNDRTQLTITISSQLKDKDWEVLSKLSNPMKMTLYGINQLSDLVPLSNMSGLRQLELGLNLAKMNNLDDLSKLSRLTNLELTLSGNRVISLEPLTRLGNLRQLTLRVFGDQVKDWAFLSRFSNLTQVTLYVNGSQVKDWVPLSELSSLNKLTLDLSYSQVGTWKLLSRFKDRTHLTLYFGENRVNDLRLLSNLSNRKQLAFSFNNSSVNDLDWLSKLTSLQSLSIENATRAQRMSLRNIPASLVELKF